MENKQKKGISLIVLVITIIVMIILAAAIILSLNGSNIIGKANEAKTKSDVANAKHVVTLAKAEWDLMTDKSGDFKTFAENKLKTSGYKIGTDGDITVSNDGAVNTVYVGEDGRKAIIPEGFAVSTNKLEDTVTEGLVIKDSAGNEFVWVPIDVPTGKTFNDIFQRTTTYKPEEGITAPEDDYMEEPYIVENYIDEKTEYDKMRTSVEENGGFYIGRYEAGTTVERKKDTNNGTTELIVQKDKFVYNWVAWGQNMTNVEGEITFEGYNQGLGAVQLSRNMYKNSASVVSTLCYSVQWDAALRFIATNKEYEDYPVDSRSKGNYTGIIEKTGSNEAYRTNNIYDMAGNVWEWSMLSYSNNTRIARVPRGSNYRNDGLEYPASSHSHDLPECARVTFAFRVALYIK